MNDIKFNYAAVIALMVLLVFGYFAFMGLVYWQDGLVIKPLLITAFGIAVAVLCVYVMTESKKSRWKIGRVGEALFGLIVLATFVAAAVPFTNFMNVLNRSSEIKSKTEQMLNTARNVDEAYDSYVSKRVGAYRFMLETVAKGKNIKPSDYAEHLAKAAGDNDEQKISNLAKSLSRQLLPMAIDSVRQQRCLWLEQASQMSVWNVMLPHNINTIADGVNDYVANYADLSKNIRQGEDTQPFTYETLSTDLTSLRKSYTRLTRPSALTLVLAVIGFALMLLPYWVADRSLAGATSSSSQDNAIYE